MRSFLSLFISLTAFTVAAAPPNIILLMGDDHGWEETGYNGHPHVKTPVLDDMVASGLRLNRFYAAHPSCSPTRVSVLTGRHPNRCGTFTPNCSTRPEEITVAHLLRDSGYATGHFGKWHVGPVKKSSPTSPGAMGFDEWLSHDNFFELNPILSRNGAPPKQYTGESSEIIVDDAILFIDKAMTRKKPFLAIVWFGSPHEPYSGLPEDLALYDDLPEKYASKKVSLTSNETGRPTKRPLREVLRERYAEITAMDRSIGKLRGYLKRTGLRDNTLLWYCGDNGTPASGEAESPLRGRKGMMYEGGIRVPGIIEWPARIPRARVSDVNSVTSDMLPTLCALVGKSLPQRPLDGINLVPLLDGRMTERPSPICFWSYTIPSEKRADLKPYIDPKLQEGTTPLVKLSRGIPTRNFVNHHQPPITEADYNGPRTILGNRYKLHLTAKGTRELYDLTADPAESKDLTRAQPEVARDLAVRMRRWQESVLKSLRGADYQKPGMVVKLPSASAPVK